MQADHGTYESSPCLEIWVPATDLPCESLHRRPEGRYCRGPVPSGSLWSSYIYICILDIYTLWLFNIAMV